MSGMRTRKRIASLSGERSLLLALVVCGAALRFSTLSLQSFDLDESVTVALLHQGFGGMLSAIPKTESTPPLYYVLAWLWTRLFGLDEVGLRSFSALCGTLTIPLAYHAATRLISGRAGLIAAALSATSPWLVWYSQEARAYALFAFLALASFALFLRALDEPKRRTLAGWAVLSALSLATHYFAVFLVVAEAAWLLSKSPARRSAAIASGFVAAVGLALLPLALHQAHDIRAKAGFLQTPLLSRIESIPTRFLLGEAAPASGRVLLVAAAGVLAGVGALALFRSADRAGRRRAGVALSVGASVVVIPLAMALLGGDYLDPRNLIAAWVPLALVVAAGYASVGRAGPLLTGGLLLLFLAMVVAGDLDAAVQRTDYRGAVAALGRSPGPGQRAIVVTPAFNWTPLAFYLPGYPRLSSGNVGVREIDLIGWQSASLGRQTVDYLARRGFRLAQDRVVQKLRLARFLAPRAVSISQADLSASRLGAQDATVLIQASG